MELRLQCACTCAETVVVYFVSEMTCRSSLTQDGIDVQLHAAIVTVLKLRYVIQRFTEE